ncbi:hypothetical protein BDV30DRAFT_230413 [Aspergillus minisclerotigenes]|uniref:Uncharacterized protein n=1 Tax=Aspergillus minisclerotigenes TaxID=656917 RepID=A0A5N6IRG7_9EURO|nr:hypothetical protein BDV30DRAFT_230413 [Aspergillus minisclerotigenes]
MAKLQDIPEIILLCMEERFITAFDEALPTQWPSFAENPKVKITVLNMGLHAVPATTKFQLVVSPANSYGRLDGAFDDAISRKFCRPHHPYDTLTRAAQQVLYEKWRGFAPPGSCTLVPFPKDMEGTNAWGCKWVAICPTMRAPDNVTWDREVVYESAGRDARIAGTGAGQFVAGVQFLTRPSASVVAVKVMGLWLLEGADKRVSVTGRFAAGVPDRVFSTWQVIGSRDIVAEVFGAIDLLTAVEDAGGGRSCCW